jgi:formate hydrogenlyase transcriptional activator
VGSSVECINGIPSFEQDSSERRFVQIIGNSPSLEFALSEVERVAPTATTVLVLGETGTGKELISRAIHNLSPRCGRPFVKLNCAAIPFDLLESELFGHEKGAFTGAIAQKIGRFEMADTGTLFLDEIGDLPLALQPKLLRVLQDQEFERLGSGKTHKVNVRLVAATHRDLGAMVNRNEFRNDLYYRLNVFPIVVPPLRERRSDIAKLVEHFVDLFGRRMGKQIDHIPDETMTAFFSYSWPGNVRELQNLVERAMIRSSDGVLSNPLPRSGHLAPAAQMREPLKKFDRDASSAPTMDAGQEFSPNGTLRESERSLILRTLEATGWVNGGAEGAAARLGLKRTTLIAKMKKLGISRPSNELGENWDGKQALQTASE